MFPAVFVLALLCLLSSSEAMSSEYNPIDLMRNKGVHSVHAAPTLYASSITSQISNVVTSRMESLSQTNNFRKQSKPENALTAHAEITPYSNSGPGYLVSKVFSNTSTCSSQSSSVTENPGLIAAVGIPIGYCTDIAVAGFSGSFKIGYGNANTQYYVLTVYVYIGSGCLFAPVETYTIPASDLSIPATCMGYTNYTIDVYNITATVPVTDLTITTDYIASNTPWTDLDVGDFTFTYTSMSQCGSASTSVTTDESAGAIWAWFAANVCVEGGMAQCSFSNDPIVNPTTGSNEPAGSLMVSTYLSTTCAASSLNASYSFDPIVCAQAPEYSYSELLEILNIDLPPGVTDDKINEITQLFVTSSYCGMYNQLVQPTHQPTPAPTPNATVGSGSSTSSAGMSSGAVAGTVAGSVLGIALVGAVVVGMLCYREQFVKLFRCCFPDDSAGSDDMPGGKYQDSDLAKPTLAASKVTTVGPATSHNVWGSNSATVQRNPLSGQEDL